MPRREQATSCSTLSFPNCTDQQADLIPCSQRCVPVSLCAWAEVVHPVLRLAKALVPLEGFSCFNLSLSYLPLLRLLLERALAEKDRPEK